MGETSHQIASQIDAARDLLYDNMQELERKVRSATDWRGPIKHHPSLSIAMAFGAGIFLARHVLRARKPSISR